MTKKTVLDYVMKEGIEGKYFVSNVIYRGHNAEYSVYKVIGHNGIDKTIPATPIISIQYLNEIFGSSSEERVRREWLGKIIQHEEATSEQIEAAREGKTLASKL